jgi:hypothetical protein
MAAFTPAYLITGAFIAWLLAIIVDVRSVSGRANDGESSMQWWTRKYAYMSCFAHCTVAGIDRIKECRKPDAAEFWSMSGAHWQLLWLAQWLTRLGAMLVSYS